MRLIRLLIILIVLFIGTTAFAYKDHKSQLVNKLIKAGAGKDIVVATFRDSRLKTYPELLKSIKGDGYNYFDPVNGILTEESLCRGKMVLAENAWLLDQIESEYGIRKEVLVSIFRVETNLGKHTGRYIVTNSLYTWATSGTRRAKWAENELLYYLKMCRVYQYDPFSIYGSTHGAFGLVQFIPSSFWMFAVDGDKDGIVDLFNFHDAMSSVANYLSKHATGKYPMRNAIYAYNHQMPYVEAVLAYANVISLNRVGN